ncbi:quercetin dioxygenase-like cupin family protein [Paraburkholderia silvatlantica]|uniref:Quercetin dioxygenase-like cupin family protein n=2 Tax=Paraburkholderia silvatlantica TaxID=321895 RepID=A0A2V4TZY7_9BURK|nr:quercetin dioxygenase-like cupin family protein [Paraburkholderia silvatlantica]
MKTAIFTPSDVLSFSNMRTRVIAGTVGTAPALTDAPYTVMEMRIGTGSGAPAHRSLDEDKTFVVHEGALEFKIGETVQRVSAGAVVTVARGDVHGFVNRETANACMLLVAAPARHDAFFRAMAALPVPHDIEAVRRICERYRQVIVGM